MLKAKKRLTKRQIKEDKLVTYYFQATDFLQRHSRNLLTALGAVVIVVMAVFLYANQKEKKEQDAVVALMEAKTEYFNGNYQGAAEKLQSIVTTYEGTESATTALFYLGNAQFQLKRYQEARAAFQDYLDNGDDAIFRVSAAAGIAACLEEMGELEAAARAYERAAESDPGSFLAPENLMGAARCYSRAGDRAAARKVLQTLLERYADPQLKNDAEVMLAQLSY